MAQAPLLSTPIASYGASSIPISSSGTASPRPGAAPSFRVYRRRWLMLALFSMHAVCNNLVCYTFAPVTDLAEEYYTKAKAFPLDMLITIFFITYVLLAFPAARFVERHGLRTGVLLGAWLQAAGATIRALDLLGNTVHSSPTDMVLLGQVVASFGQSFFVIPPPLLASTWFAEDERTLATTVACNADVLGIAVAYMICPYICQQVNHVPYLLQIIAILSFGMAIISTLLFEAHPPQPPSYSALMRVLDQERSTTVSRIIAHQIEHSRSIKRQITLSRYQIIDSHFVEEQPADNADAPSSQASQAAPPAVIDEEPEHEYQAPTTRSSVNSTDVSPQRSPRSHRASLDRVPEDEYRALDDETIEAPNSSPKMKTAASASTEANTMPSLVVEPSPRTRGQPATRSLTSMQTNSPQVHSHRSHHAQPHQHQAHPPHHHHHHHEEHEEIDDDDAHEDADAHAELIAEHGGGAQPTWTLFREPGFVHATFAFAIGETTLNAFSTFMNSMLVPGGFSAAYVSLMGTFFVLSALLGSQLASTLVDKYKWYQPMMMLSFFGSVVTLIAFNQLTSIAEPSSQWYWVTATILLVGFFVGPLQPISCEIAAEVVYPVTEASSTAVQQVIANLLSAGMIPLMLLLKDPVTQNMNKANWVMASTMLLCGLFYLNFNGTYRRLQADQEYEQRRAPRPRIEIGTS